MFHEGTDESDTDMSDGDDSDEETESNDSSDKDEHEYFDVSEGIMNGEPEIDGSAHSMFKLEPSPSIGDDSYNLLVVHRIPTGNDSAYNFWNLYGKLSDGRCESALCFVDRVPGIKVSRFCNCTSSFGLRVRGRVLVRYKAAMGPTYHFRPLAEVHVHEGPSTEVVRSSPSLFAHDIMPNQLMVDLRSCEPEYDGCAVIITEVGIESVNLDNAERPFSPSIVLLTGQWFTRVDLLRQQSPNLHAYRD